MTKREPRDPGVQLFWLHTKFSHSRSLDLDLPRRLLSLSFFGQFHNKHALLEARFDLVQVNTFRQFKTALERTETTLLEVIVLLLLFLFLLLLALHCQNTVSHFDFDVLLIHSR